MTDTLQFIVHYLNTHLAKHSEILPGTQVIIIPSSGSNADLSHYIFTILLALLAGLIALYQVKSNTISSSRIDWIENLRETLSEYCVRNLDTLTYLRNMIANGAENGVGYEGFKEDYHRYFECSTKANTLGYKARLYLNPKEDKHKQIIVLIDKITDLLENAKFEEIETEIVQEEVNSIITLANQVFREEWSKSKKLFKL